MPRQLGRLSQRRQGPVVPAMPSLLAHRRERDVLFWPAPFSRTLLEQTPEVDPQLQRLRRLLDRGGIAARIQPDVARRNQATTTCFFGLQLALFAAGGCATLARCERLLRLQRRASGELAPLAATLGAIDPGIRLLSRCSRPWQLKALLKSLGRFAPQVTAFIDDHFAHKLGAQHRALADEILELGRQHGCPLPALRELAAGLGG